MIEYGLIGHPLGHSFSRQFFTEKFEREGLDADYLNFDIESIDQLPQLIASHPNLRGLNVTIPYKQAVIPYLDELSDEARAIGAVNVIRINGSNLKGFNSDIIGFMDSIRPLLKPHHRKALVLGTGGASKAICCGLDKLGLKWRYVSRRASSSSVSNSIAGTPPVLTYAEITPSILAEYTVIVNCTPLGMYPRIDSCPEIQYNALTSDHLLYDLVYNPDITLFMRQGRRYGATVKNGLEMLHLQALASWKFWNGTD